MINIESAIEGTTAQFAGKYFVKPETVRTRYCLTGSYHGIIPRKLLNGRLAWPLPESGADSKVGAA